MISISISWPAPALWQNRRVHWSKRAASASLYRAEARVTTQCQLGFDYVRTSDSPRLTFRFHPPDKRRRDLQNMPATAKSAIDGIADALGCDDQHFRCVWPETWGEVIKGGKVQIEISDD